jgi:hypothetical protein
VGKAFPLRDDLRTAFGSAALTGKPWDVDFFVLRATSGPLGNMAIAGANQAAA